MRKGDSIFSSANHRKEEIFLRREYNSVKGKKNGILIMLAAILFFSLFSVVLGKAGLDYLTIKMNDPFIKWFNIPVSNSNFRGDYAEIKKFFDTNAESGKYSISQSTGSYRSLWRFFPKKGGGTTAAFVQSFDFWGDRDLLQNICNNENLIRSYADLENLTPEQLQDGVIISSNLHKDLGCTLEELGTRKIMIQNGDYLPLTVLAVVRSLPYKSHVFAENRLVFTLNQYGSSDASGSISARQDQLSLYILAKNAETESRLSNQISKILKEDSGLDYENLLIKDTDLPLISQNKQFVFTGLSKEINLEIARKINSAIAEEIFAYNPALVVEHSLMVPHQNMQYGDPKADGYKASNMFDILSFKMDDLSQIPDFQDVALDKFEMEFDLSQVEAKQNFGVVSFLSIFLILSLVIFAGFAILIYLFNLMKNHLEKISVNLGTLLAFGLPKGFLYQGYLKILFKLIITATILAIAVLFLLIIGLRAIQPTLNLPEFLTYMRVLQNAWIWAVAIAFFAISYLLFKKLLKSFLSCPPGDLIYNRS